MKSAGYPLGILDIIFSLSYKIREFSTLYTEIGKEAISFPYSAELLSYMLLVKLYG